MSTEIYRAEDESGYVIDFGKSVTYRLEFPDSLRFISTEALSPEVIRFNFEFETNNGREAEFSVDYGDGYKLFGIDDTSDEFFSHFYEPDFEDVKITSK